MNNELPIYPLIFTVNDDNKLIAEFNASDIKPPLDIETIQELLNKQGLANLSLYEDALPDLLTQYRTANAGFEREIGERLDGVFTIAIADNKMLARLNITPPYGGANVTQIQIMAALQEMGVTRGIMVKKIAAAVKTGYANDLIIAQGLAAVNGSDTTFQSLIVQASDRKPGVDSHGAVDFRDTSRLIVVNPGDPVMFRSPQTTGKNGFDIKGHVLLAQAGQFIPYASELIGVKIATDDDELDPDNNSLLLAAITGQPRLILNGVVVEPIINLPFVDISTGNVRFDGTINILGDVKDGMTVYAGGDVFVGGTVEAAEITAGGNITIKGGVIGHGALGGDVSEEVIFNANIISKGSISARFAENAYMKAEVDITLEEFSMHSELTALNRILVANKKGRIIGGVACAMLLIKVGTLGAESGVITKISAGYNPFLQVEMDKLTLDIEANEKEQADIKKIHMYVLSNPKKDNQDLLQKVMHTREKLEADYPHLQDERRHLLARMTLPENVQVIVDQAVHSGTEIQIGNAILKNTRERGRGVFHIDEGKVKFGDIMLSICK